jgi:hypothetical protein
MGDIGFAPSGTWEFDCSLVYKYFAATRLCQTRHEKHEPSLTVGLLPRLLRRPYVVALRFNPHRILTAVIPILVTILEPFAIVAAVEFAVTKS